MIVAYLSESLASVGVIEGFGEALPNALEISSRIRSQWVGKLIKNTCCSFGLGCLDYIVQWIDVVKKLRDVQGELILFKT